MITAVTSSTRTMCMACLTSGAKATSSRSALSCSSAICRYLFDENHVHGVPDKWSEGYEFALSLVMFKCHEGLTDEDRQRIADWREKHWKDTK
nr:MAG TPA: hypothetical protein [Caudoviricetes sp.]